MAKIALSLKINLNDIDMSRVFQGKKGQYLDATIFVEMNELDQYGNSGMITQDVSKDEKQQGVKGNILGNGKVFWVENGQAPQQAGTNAPQQGGFQQQTVPQQQGGFQQQAAPQQQQGGYQQKQSNQQQGGFGGQQQQQAPQQQGGYQQGQAFHQG